MRRCRNPGGRERVAVLVREAVTQPPKSRAALPRPPFSVLALVLLAVFLVTRLPFFWFDPKVQMSLDSAGYLQIADQMRAGHWPVFSIRTPGYPVLIWLVTSVVNRWLAVVVAQNLMSFAAALALVYAVHRLRPGLALAAALAMCGFLGSSQVLVYDISLLSESFYTSTLMLALASLFMALALDSAWWFAGASTLMAASLLIRPAGAYLVVIYALVAVFLMWNRFRWRPVVGFAAPFPLILIVLCAYNFATFGQFVYSAFGEANLAGATALFWEPDPRLPPRVNAALAGMQDSYRKVGITQGDLALLHESWAPEPLFELFVKAYNRLVWSAGWGMGYPFGGRDYLQNRMYIRDASLMAIRRHPDLYGKYVWVNLVMFFDGIGYKFDFDSSQKYRETAPIPSEVRGDDLRAGAARTVVATAPPGPSADPAAASGLERFLRSLRLVWQSVHGFVYQQVFWTWAYFAMLAASAVQLARFRGRHAGAFLLFVLGLIPLGAGLVVCLVEVATDRYSYPTQFICYLLVALAPLLTCASLRIPAEKGPAARP